MNRPDGAQVQLVWPGKRETYPEVPRLSPRVLERGEVQTRSDTPANLDLFAPKDRTPEGRPSWTNRLYWADNLLALGDLLERHAGQVDLVYLDPPFATGSTFTIEGAMGEGTAEILKPGHQTVAYADDWGTNRAAWFSMIHERLLLVRDLLSDRGTLYLHLAWAAGHHVRPLLDEVFGPENSLGEVIWAYGSPSGGRAAGQKLVKAHDLILVFAKCHGKHRFKPVHLPYSEKYVRDWFKYEDEDGRRYRKRWRRDKSGRSYFEKQYLDESKGVPASTVWSDIQQVYADPRAYKLGAQSEVTGYPPQKPGRLLERILEISSEPGDLVADLFCGSGTTVVTAERLGRRWLGCDTGRFAIHTTRERLLASHRRAPFEILGFGGEERRYLARRRALTSEELAAELAAAHVSGGASGKRAVRVCVGPLERPFKVGEAKKAIEECARAGRNELHLLAWEWGAEAGRIDEAACGVGVEVLRRLIPREALEPDNAAHAGEVPDVGWAIEAGDGGPVVRLLDYRLRRPNLLPAGVRRQMKSWSDLLSFWSVDFAYDGEVFNHQWWAFRTRRDRRLPLTSAVAKRMGSRVAIMLVDVLGQAHVREGELAGSAWATKRVSSF